ncbi:MAG: hypothetical protein M1834_000883 [Cirrosporium novae-zelandiae]|nr:MAG: hypothetical protein M1834_000883 [Cirrosporium novae-zelandiae]
MATQTMHASPGTPSMPANPHTGSTSHHRSKKPWRQVSRHSFHSSRSYEANEESQEYLSQQATHTTRSSRPRRPKWWKVRFFRGMIKDVKRRLPFYWSDWTDAWDYRELEFRTLTRPHSILPALAFSLDMFSKTDESFGVNEVLLASVLGSVVFSVFAAQPLTIVGVTGPITVFNYTVYDIIHPMGINYFAFLCWIGLWSLVMHWILAITNACNGLTYVTRFSCDIFGFYVAFIYLQKGIQVLVRQWSLSDPTAAYLSITVALLVLGAGYICGLIGNSNLFQRTIRKFIEDYGTPLTIVFFTGFVHIGRMKGVDLTTLPTSKAFFPTPDRGWFVHFWDIGVGDVFLAIPFAFLLTILFYFDHNVSSLIAQGTEFPLRKPAGFHWDIFLLGLTTGIAGLLGIPFPNGLIPQAPFHTNSLCVTRQIADEDDSNKGKTQRVVDHVVEQRVSNLAQGLLTLGTMTGPLLIVLHLIPQGVLAGLFFIMGVQALEGNGITLKILYLCKDRSLTARSDLLGRIERKQAIWVFVATELISFGATFAITQTIAAIGFPIIIFLLVPFRTFLMPKYFTQQELGILDAPTASPFTMESVGGVYGDEENSLPVSEGEEEDTSSRDNSGKDSGMDTYDEGDLSERGLAPGVKGTRKSFRSEETDGAIEMQRLSAAAKARRRSSNRREGEPSGEM